MSDPKYSTFCWSIMLRVHTALRITFASRWWS
jgi:hypothetical protein